MATPDSDTERWVNDRLEVLAPPEGWEPHDARGLAALRSRLASARRRHWMKLTAAAATAAVLLTGMPVLKGFAHACGEYVRRSLSGGSVTHSNIAARSAAATIESLTDVNGRPFSASDHLGKVVLVSYWPEDCRQCSTEAEWFREFETEYRARGFVVIQIRVRPGDVSRAGVPSAIPTSLLLDRSARVAVRHVGYCSKREFESDIQALLAEP